MGGASHEHSFTQLTPVALGRVSPAIRAEDAMGGFSTKRVLQAVLIAGLVASHLAVWSGTTAQEPAPGTERITPDPATCQVEGRTLAELKAIFATATPVAEQAPATFTIPTGSPADDVTAAQIVAAVHEAIACLNAGDFSRFFGLLTDQAIVTSFSWLAEPVAAAQVPADLGFAEDLPEDQ